MKDLKEHIVEGLKIGAKTKVNTVTYNYHPKDKDELKELIKKRGNNANLNDIDVSGITDMSKLFFGTEFNGNISEWDVSNVKYMNAMFQYSEFNGDISKWDVSNVKNMIGMFQSSKFTGENGDISGWDVRNVKFMLFMFDDCPLEKNPPKWYRK